MTDLIDRLLAGPQPDRHSGVIMEEAADEIERLNQQLAEAHNETDSVVYARDEAYRMLASYHEVMEQAVEDLKWFSGQGYDCTKTLTALREALNKKPAGVRLHAEAWRVLLDEVYKDAARYRYLRHESRRKCLDLNGPEAGCWIDCEDEHHTLVLLTGEDADKAIDAAMEHDDVQR